MAQEPAPLIVTETEKERAETYKTEANKYFSLGDMEKAIDLYTEAISYNPNVAAYYSNRSFGNHYRLILANFKQELYGAALSDASEAIRIDNTFVKAYYRRASANMALGRLKEAIKDFKSVVNVAPQDPNAKGKLSACQKEFRRIEFEKAIYVENIKVTAIELLGDIDAIVVEDSYAVRTLPELIIGPSIGR
jgi:serine/threonine-protein phosphatase 5